jgi:multiple sugar transport system substrate-binding protein
MGAGRRTAWAVIAFALVLAGCTPESVSSPTPVDDDGWTERGPITLAVESGAAQLIEDPVKAWNTTRPREQVTVVELPSRGGDRAPGMADRAQAGSGEYTVVMLEAAATREFAAKGWLVDLPAGDFPTDGMADAAVASATYDGALYAYPLSVDVGVLYYRADLLAQFGLTPPTTWAGLRAVCAKVLLHNPSRSCYAGQLGARPDLSSDIAEAIWSAGGEFVDGAGTPAVSSTAATAGLSRLAEGVAAGLIPEAALTWSGSGARRALDAGSVVFLRDWWSARATLDADSSAPGAVGMTVLPGDTGQGVAVLGGRNLGISANSRNRGTAADFLRYLTSASEQKSLAASGLGAPALTDLVSDAALVKTVPSLRTFSSALKAARPLPATTEFRQFTKDVEETLLPALKGEQKPAEALASLEDRLAEVFR